MLFDLWLRYQTLSEVNSGIFPWVFGGDAWYNIHLVEQIIPNFPSYPWYDPMNQYPTGRINNWGPLFPLITAFICILGNSQTTTEIIRCSSFVPPLLSICMIPLAYVIGKKIIDTKAGLCSAFMIACISGEYQFRSMYGYPDHHLLESVLSTLFITLYIYLLIEFSRSDSQKFGISPKVVLLAVIAGVVYYAGIMNMPTMLLFAFIITLFTLLYPLFLHNSNAFQKLCLVNIISFGVFTLFFLLTGIHHQGFHLRDYSIGHVYIGLLLIIGNCFLFILSNLHKKKIRNILLVLLPLGILCIGIIYSKILDIWQILFDALYGFIFAARLDENIEELGMMVPGTTLYIYNLAIPLLVIGLILLIMRFHAQRRDYVFLSILWSVVLLGLSIQQARYQYYGAICATFLSGVALSWMSEKICQKWHKKTNNGPILFRSSYSSTISKIKICPIGLICMIIVLLLFAFLSFLPLNTYVTVDIPSKELYAEDWKSALLWMNDSTPNYGFDYHTIYSKNNFLYPKDVYTVGSGVNQGLKVLGIGKRIPSSSIFLGTYPSNEYTSHYNPDIDKKLDKKREKYFISSSDLFTDIIGADTTSAYEGSNNRILPLYSQIDSGHNLVLVANGLKDSFFKSLFARLYFFDGSEIQAKENNSVRYDEILINGKTYNLIQKNNPSGFSQILNTNGLRSRKTEIVSFNSTRSTINLPAISTFRLVYESSSVVSGKKADEIHHIKIFEHVKGHTIPGTGTIELPLVTNQGRNFTYRQQSVNNTFTLPYSTTNSPYDVHATGPYRIIETNETFEVDESQIEKYYI
ncbi:oligosaccharyl transferase, archaeosortase A system-associated [Methanospirillum sp. J.3.6.1-F.2.7.3]|uniref:dolichyl-phosphooligosaccharide-protein glycotransferase n=2 Tax=Methanospirillum purgamenti TaxID=2834276 RepID=A0A8E7EHB1_9EURY|nr:oligosaccharyl transferase, archaeosortase A system-associated [Methanospirillum sp. J.3.6.1-F.2.7.3]